MSVSSPGGRLLWEPGNMECSNRYDGLMDSDFPELVGKKAKRQRKEKPIEKYTKVQRLDTNTYNGPKYLIVTRNDGSADTMQNVSPFLIKKAIDYTAGKNVEIKKLRNGTLLLKTVNSKQSENLLKLTSFFDQVKVIITLHKTLNSSKGVITCRDLEFVSDEEILENLKSQNVCDLYRFKRRVEGNLVNTYTFVITFNSPVLPDDITAGYIFLKVRPYIPQPMRCYQCQQFGHITKFCKREALCGVCADKVDLNHISVECKNTPKCINCGDSHPSSSKMCSVYKKEFAIQEIKVSKNIPYYQAKNE